MNAETWLPIVTLVLGWAGAQITEVLRDRRTSDRELQARRAELQRSTLLDLQDVLLEMFNLTTEVSVYPPLPEKLRRLESEGPLAELVEQEREARTRLRGAHAKVSLLTSRVIDAKARHAVTLFVAISQLATPTSGQPATADSQELSERYHDAIERLGELIRERY
jgi:hypothetical protein